jgi:hypothetical protein
MHPFFCEGFTQSPYKTSREEENDGEDEEDEEETKA